MGAWGSAAPIAARGEEEEDEAGGAGWVKLMVRSTGDSMEEDWAVDLAVSKLEEGRDGGNELGGEVEGREGRGGTKGGGRGGEG